MSKADNFIAAGWIEGIIRPEDCALVVYLFEPFMSLYVGVYHTETDSVAGNAGFTSWRPEVLCWYPLPNRHPDV